MAKNKNKSEANKKTSDKHGLNLIFRPIIILIVISGAFVPSYGPFDIYSFYILIYAGLFIYYLVRLLKAIFSKKPESKKDIIWYLIIFVIICIPMRHPIYSMRIEVIKNFAIKVHEDCNIKKQCSQIKNLPWTNGRFVTKKNTSNTFELSHWHMEDVYHFFGGVGKDLTFKYYWADDYDEKNTKYYKYSNNKWILQK